MKIKKIISALVSTAMAFSLLSLVPARVSAASDASGTGWSFTAADGKLSFDINYTGIELTADIINGLDGDATEGGAFQNTDVKILDTGESAITSIGFGAFSYTSLKTVSLPNAITIGTGAFIGCSYLTTVTLPKTTNIGYAAFNWCNLITTIDLPEVVSIGEEAFFHCDGLQSITFGKLTPPSLGKDVFAGVDQSKVKINIPYNADINAWKTAFDAVGYTTVKLAKLAPPPVINITTPQSDFIGGVTGTPYNVALAGSEPGFTYSLDLGSLPDGLTLSADGIISGTPTAAGTFTFTVKATNGVSTTTQTYTITVTQPYVDDWYTTRRRNSLPIGGYTIHDHDEEAEDTAAGAGVVSEEL